MRLEFKAGSCFVNNDWGREIHLGYLDYVLGDNLVSSREIIAIGLHFPDLSRLRVFDIAGPCKTWKVLSVFDDGQKIIDHVITEILNIMLDAGVFRFFRESNGKISLYRFEDVKGSCSERLLSAKIAETAVSVTGDFDQFQPIKLFTII